MILPCPELHTHYLNCALPGSHGLSGSNPRRSAGLFFTPRNPFARPLTKYRQATGGTLIFIAAVAIGARLYLRLGIQKRRLLSSDILMSLAWVASVVTEAFTIKLAQSNALDPKVKSTFEGFEGSSEELAFVLKVGTMPNFVGCNDGN